MRDARRATAEGWRWAELRDAGRATSDAGMQAVRMRDERCDMTASR